MQRRSWVGDILAWKDGADVALSSLTEGPINGYCVDIVFYSSVKLQKGSAIRKMPPKCPMLKL